MGSGVDRTAHTVPFHHSANGSFVADPTATQAPADGHEIEKRLPLGTPSFGVFCIAQGDAPAEAVGAPDSGRSPLVVVPRNPGGVGPPRPKHRECPQTA